MKVPVRPNVIAAIPLYDRLLRLICLHTYICTQIHIYILYICMYICPVRPKARLEKKLHRLFESWWSPLGIMGTQLKAHLKLLETIVPWCLKDFQWGALNYGPMMPRVASLSDSCSNSSPAIYDVTATEIRSCPWSNWTDHDRSHNILLLFLNKTTGVLP